MVNTIKNYILVNNSTLNITISAIPEPYARTITPLDSPEIAKEKEDFPFKLKNGLIITVEYKNKSYILELKDGFIWNGASIPKWLWIFTGSNADPEYLLPSMVHDLLCNNRGLIDRNRYLSSLIFRELLIACGVPKFKANSMFFAVDNFQKFCGW